MSKFVAWFDRLLKNHFFQPADAISLSLFRFLYATLLIATLLKRGDKYVRMYETTTWYPTPLFELLGIPLVSVQVFQILQWVLLGALAFLAIGLFTRTAATVSWIAFFFVMGTSLGFGKSPHTDYVVHSTNVVVVVLFVLSVAPGAATYGIDGWRRRGWRWHPDEAGATISAWPTQLIKLSLALAYFGAGYCKVVTSPLWADGYTLQAYLMSKHLILDCDAGAWVAQQYWLCLLLGIATLVLELTFYLLVFYPRLTWWYVAAAIGFHTSIYLTMQINFFPYYGLTFLIFLDWPTIRSVGTWLAKLGRGVIAGETSGRATVPFAAATNVSVGTLGSTPGRILVGDTRAARIVVAGLWGLLAICIFARVEAWPLTDYRVFNSRNQIQRVCVYRLAGIDETGNQVWIPRSWMPLSPTSINGRFQAHLRHGSQADAQAMLAEMAAHIAKCDKAGKIKSVVLVQRKLRQTADTNLLEPVDLPVAKLALGGQSEPAAIIATGEGGIGLQ
jgi:hypothetical protein